MEPFIGQLMLVPYNFNPSGWIDCSGQLLSISSNSALFSLLGTTYGGDGETSFGVPDLRGRVPIHEGTGPGLPTYNLGQKSGNPTSTLVTANLPAHSHPATANVNSADAANETPAIGNSIAAPGYVEGRSFLKIKGFNTATPDVALNAATISVANTGSNTSFSNMPPYLTMRWVIALIGIYPSRA
ncbi:MAG: tail fiber protein [Gilvibacter sp.]